MQRHTGAADFLYQRFAAFLDFFEIRRGKWRFGRARKNQVGDLKIADRPVVGRGDPADLLRDAE
jgi:hypothetical protein